MSERILAFDIGSSSGRAMVATYKNNKIEMEEIHRFSNDPVKLGNTLYWDILRLFHEIKQGISKAVHSGGFTTLGIDTWGVDFGLLDKNGRLLENPIHYRDTAFQGYMDKVLKKIPADKLYEITGIQNMDINTICQLYYLVENRPELIERAETLLFMPDLLRYMLSGEKNTEYTIASTSQLLDAKKRDWSWEIIDILGLPRRLFTKIIMPGEISGKISEDICEELGVKNGKIIAVGEHDTASAVVAVPATKKEFAYLSCGSWSLFGTELVEPFLEPKAVSYNITNEGGYGNTIRFLKNISGLWMIQEARRQWIREGQTYSYAELEKLALACEPFKFFVDPDHPSFVQQGDHPKRVRDYCRATGQAEPQTVGEVMRCIYESLALKYRYTLETLEDCTSVSYEKLHVVGGGTKDKLLCQMTANACDREVVAGPIEATVLGNVAVQMITNKQVKDIHEAREAVANSEALTGYSPNETDKWENAYLSYKKALKI